MSEGDTAEQGYGGKHSPGQSRERQRAAGYRESRQNRRDTLKSRRQNRAASYVLITGASSGIGAAFARRFAKEGYSLILTARRADRLADLRQELLRGWSADGAAAGSDEGVQIKPELTASSPEDAAGLSVLTGKGDRCPVSPDILLIPADLSRTEEVCRLFREIGDRRLRILVNNAGFGDCGPFTDTDPEKDMAMIDVNVKAMHLILKLGLQRMQGQNAGAILNVASSAGLLPAGPFMTTYYATKSYVVSLTRGVAEELRESGSPIYVGALCPGPVNTEFNRAANVKTALPGISPEECVEYAVEQMKRRRTIIIPTPSLKLAAVGGNLIPAALTTRITARQQRKKMGSGTY